MSIYCKNFLAIYHTFLDYSHILWETTISTLELTDNRSVTKFCQTKTTPPAVWNACDYVLQFKFRTMHLTGFQNRAANFLSQLELTLKEKVQLKLRDNILTSPIEVNLQSTDVADQELFSFCRMKRTSWNKIFFARKALSKQRAIDVHEKKRTFHKRWLMSSEDRSTPQSTHSEQSKKMLASETNKMLIFSSKRLNYGYYTKSMTKNFSKRNREEEIYYAIIMKDGILMRK